MKHRTKPTPDYTIKESGGVFKVYDKNGHYRRPFSTRQGAEDFITEQRTGKVRQATADMTQAAATA